MSESLDFGVGDSEDSFGDFDNAENDFEWDSESEERGTFDIDTTQTINTINTTNTDEPFVVAEVVRGIVRTIVEEHLENGLAVKVEDPPAESPKIAKEEEYRAVEEEPLDEIVAGVIEDMVRSVCKDSFPIEEAHDEFDDFQDEGFGEADGFGDFEEWDDDEDDNFGHFEEVKEEEKDEVRVSDEQLPESEGVYDCYTTGNLAGLVKHITADLTSLCTKRTVEPEAASNRSDSMDSELDANRIESFRTCGVCFKDGLCIVGGNQCKICKYCGSFNLKIREAESEGDSEYEYDIPGNILEMLVGSEEEGNLKVKIPSDAENIDTKPITWPSLEYLLE